jgi:hypothetical protein
MGVMHPEEAEAYTSPAPKDATASFVMRKDRACMARPFRAKAASQMHQYVKTGSWVRA